MIDNIFFDTKSYFNNHLDGSLRVDTIIELAANIILNFQSIR
ncbi:MAG: hypothetical protein AB8V06_01970 [Francisella endosymbiont of Hyalomma asiaticum]